MKKFFKAIGNFFVKIWRWIKETAWVQPLLIVSLIFGVILLIQPISEGIVALGDLISNNKKYYKDNQVHLIGGDAMELIYDEEARFKDDDKYFLVFVNEDCENCNELYPAFKLLLENKDNIFTKDIKIKTIYTDEQGDDYDIKTDKASEMYKIFFGEDFTSGDLNVNVNDFRNAIYSAHYNSPYYTELKDDERGYFDEMLNAYDLYTPLILLIDKECENNPFNIKEALVGLVAGQDDYDRAELLDNCWNSEKKFAN